MGSHRGDTQSGLHRGGHIEEVTHRVGHIEVITLQGSHRGAHREGRIECIGAK